MTERKGKRGSTPQFGGDWTTRKLEVLAGYLRSYTTALKDKPTAATPFRKAFIDAFAGTGYRESRHAGDSEEPASGLLFPDLAEPEPGALLDGSARIALQTQPRFDRYIFIEQSQGRRAQLSALKAEFADLADDIEILAGDANEQIRNICGKDWRSHRAVLFLDTFGMQVEWRTIEAVATTKAIDLWLLFPLGIGVNRLLTKSGDIPDAWRKMAVQKSVRVARIATPNVWPRASRRWASPTMRTGSISRSSRTCSICRSDGRDPG